MKLFLRCCGGESDKFVSHAYGEISLISNRRGGEEFFVSVDGNQQDKNSQTVFIECGGGE